MNDADMLGNNVNSMNVSSGCMLEKGACTCMLGKVSSGVGEVRLRVR